MALSSDDGSFTEQLRLPLPPRFSGQSPRLARVVLDYPGLSNAYLAMSDAQASAFLDTRELDPMEVANEDLNGSVVDAQGVTSVDSAATAGPVTFSR